MSKTDNILSENESVFTHPSPISANESLKDEQRKAPKEEIDSEEQGNLETVESPINDRVVLTERKNGFRMGTDSVLLSKFVKASPTEKGVDLGTGSGVIPLLLLSENKGSEIKGVEIQESLYNLAKLNATKNGFETRFHPINQDIRKIKTVLDSESADFVTVNPPYFKKGSGKQSENTEKVIARHEMNGTINDFCSAASFCLKYGGRFYAVFRADRLTELLYAMKENKIEPKHIELIYKKDNVETVLVQGTKGANSGLKITVKETALVHS